MHGADTFDRTPAMFTCSLSIFSVCVCAFCFPGKHWPAQGRNHLWHRTDIFVVFSLNDCFDHETQSYRFMLIKQCWKKNRCCLLNFITSSLGFINQKIETHRLLYLNHNCMSIHVFLCMEWSELKGYVAKWSLSVHFYTFSTLNEAKIVY